MAKQNVVGLKSFATNIWVNCGKALIIINTKLK